MGRKVTATDQEILEFLKTQANADGYVDVNAQQLADYFSMSRAGMYSRLGALVERGKLRKERGTTYKILPSEGPDDQCSSCKRRLMLHRVDFGNQRIRTLCNVCIAQILARFS
jgi:hypothetical protein